MSLTLTPITAFDVVDTVTDDVAVAPTAVTGKAIVVALTAIGVVEDDVGLLQPPHKAPNSAHVNVKTANRMAMSGEQNLCHAALRQVRTRAR